MAGANFDIKVTVDTIVSIIKNHIQEQWPDFFEQLQVLSKLFEDGKFVILELEHRTIGSYGVIAECDLSVIVQKIPDYYKINKKGIRSSRYYSSHQKCITPIAYLVRSVKTYLSRSGCIDSPGAYYSGQISHPYNNTQTEQILSAMNSGVKQLILKVIVWWKCRKGNNGRIIQHIIDFDTMTINILGDIHMLHIGTTPPVHNDVFLSKEVYFGW
jgi:hypothetical protein